MHLPLIFAAASLVPFVAAHCKITAAKGNLGGATVALGITAGSGNSQSDVTVFKNGAAFGQTQAVSDIRCMKTSINLRLIYRVAKSIQPPRYRPQ